MGLFMISCVYVTPFTRDLIFPRSVLYSQPKGVSFQLLRLFTHNTRFGKQGLISVEAGNPLLFASRDDGYIFSNDS